MAKELYAKNDLIKIIATGEQPGFKYRLDSGKFVDGMKQVASFATEMELPQLTKVYTEISDTINSAREGKPIEPKSLPEGVTYDHIMSHLPFNKFMNRLDVLSFVCLAAHLTYGNYKE